MSTPRTDLSQTLPRLDGSSYSAYKQLKGSWRLGAAELVLDRVQSDPYAPPSLARVRLPLRSTGIPSGLIASKDRRVAVGDFLTRQFSRAARELGPRGGKDSGGISIQSTGQEILERSSVVVPDPAAADAYVEVRCEIALPAAGRRIKGHAAHRLLTEVLPGVVERALRYENLDARALQAHVTSHLDAQHLREQLPQRGLVAFVADSAVLPRASGHRDEPLARGAVPFETPPELRVELELEDGSTVSGMGIPEGVTVVVGGGYHGKSTLLQALERGVYSHVPGDGRERVVTLPSAMSVRAEDGRAVSHTDVSPFINNLPTGADTRDFSTSNASGSTSQAAATVEAVEAQAAVLLLDEDTCATNLMVRDERMRAMVPGEREPITPFVDRVGALYTERGVSSILVTGAPGRSWTSRTWWWPWTPTAPWMSPTAPGRWCGTSRAPRTCVLRHPSGRSARTFLAVPRKHPARSRPNAVPPRPDQVPRGTTPPGPVRAMAPPSGAAGTNPLALAVSTPSSGAARTWTSPL